MRILSLSRTYPYPPVGGSEIRIWNMVSQLARRHDVLLLTAGAPSQKTPPAAAPAIESHPAAPLPPTPWRRGGRLLASVLSGVPAAIAAGRSRALERRLRALCHRGWPDVVIAEEGAAAAELRWVPRSIPRVLVKHSVHAREVEELPRLRGIAGLARGLHRRALLRFERRSLREATHVIALTEEDGEELVRRYGPVEWTLVANGVDRTEFPPRDKLPDTRVVACLANFAWAPNVREAVWLAEKVWPRVVSEDRAAELRLVGRGMPAEAAAWVRSRGAVVTGPVGSVARAFREVAVAALPVRYGSGIRNRLLAMLSLGVPTVTTTLGMRGVAGAGSAAALVADSEADFAGAIVCALQDGTLRQRLSHAGQQVAERFTWEAAAERLEDVLQRIAR